MQEINLLNSEKTAGKSKERRHLPLYITIGLFVVELMFYGFLVIRDRQIAAKTAEVEKAAAGVDLELSQIDADRKAVVSVQSRLANLDALLNDHVYWSEVFKELESVSFKPVRLDSLQVDRTDSTFLVSGLAPSQTDLAKYIKGLLTSPRILDVRFQNVSAKSGDEPGIAFGLEIVFDPKLLIK